MAHLVGSFQFEHPQWPDFLEKTRQELKAETFYNVMRWYVGAVNVNLSLHQVSEFFLLRDWIKPLIAQIIDCHKDPEWTVYREGTFCASGKKAMGVPFVATNFTDNVCRRYHYVIQGTGRFTCLDNTALSVDYEPGCLLCFSDEDYGQRWRNTYSDFTEQIVVCLGRPADKHTRNWELFSAFHNRGVL